MISKNVMVQEQKSNSLLYLLIVLCGIILVVGILLLKKYGYLNDFKGSIKKTTQTIIRGGKRI
jgi:hypothetical protein